MCKSATVSSPCTFQHSPSAGPTLCPSRLRRSLLLKTKNPEHDSRCIPSASAHQSLETWRRPWRTIPADVHVTLHDAWISTSGTCWDDKMDPPIHTGYFLIKLITSQRTPRTS